MSVTTKTTTDADDAGEALATFQRYTQAFGSLDPRAPGKYFHEPALMVSPDGVFVLPDPSAVEQAYRGVMSRLPGMGYARSTFPGLSAQRLSDDLAVVSSDCIWETADGKPITRSHVHYTLRRQGEEWKILTALVYY